VILIQEEALGNAMAENVIEKYKEHIVADTAPIAVQISAVVDDICTANGLGKRKLIIINDAKPNAFVLGGKYIFVFTGLFKPLTNVGQVAFVIGHEIGHTMAGHWGEGLLRNGAATAVAIFLSIFGGQVQASSSLMQMLMVLPKSRVNEKEADIIGFVRQGMSEWQWSDTLFLQVASV
jgi:Zn-dependent protease with chaperone function